MRIVPFHPTARAVPPSGLMATDLRVSEVPLGCAVQVSPRSVVLRTVPSFPTARAVPPSGLMATDQSCSEVPLGCAVQVSPRSVVLRIVPSPATAKAVRPSTDSTTEKRGLEMNGNRRWELRSIGYRSRPRKESPIGRNGSDVSGCIIAPKVATAPSRSEITSHGNLQARNQGSRSLISLSAMSSPARTEEGKDVFGGLNHGAHVLH